MKKHFYYVVYQYTTKDGFVGTTAAEAVLGRQITAFEHIECIVADLVKEEDKYISALVINYILLRVEG